jgi:2-polyprenyl-3-methyl-5-hydroxy-6-metoxy-1,4-benzoquinol methylase
VPAAKRPVRDADQWRGFGGTGRFPQLPLERGAGSARAPSALTGRAAPKIETAASKYPAPLAEGRRTAGTQADVAQHERKRAEEEYPLRAEQEGGLQWLREKPFGNTAQETSRLLIDFGYVVRLLELEAGMSLCELGCGSGWMTRLAARHGVEATGYDISPRMIEIAREQALAESVDARFEVADMETLDLGRSFDACLLYDALHHSPRADLVLQSAHRALRSGGRLVLAEPNWAHRFRGRETAGRFGTTELGYTPRSLKRMLRSTGFGEVQRFHVYRRFPTGNSPRDVLWHLAGPLTTRVLAPFWTQIWLRATAE